MENTKKIGWGQFLLLLFMCRAFALMTFTPLSSAGGGLSLQMAAAAISAVIQAVLLIPTVLLKKSATGAALEKNKAFGIFAAVLYLLFFLFYTAGSLLHFQDFLQARFFPTSDSSLWITALLIVCVYCACRGIEALGRSGVLLFWLFIAALVIMCISSAQDLDLDNISFGADISGGLFSAVMDDLARSGEICAAAFLAGHVREKLRCGVYGMLASKLILIAAVTLLITAVLGDFAVLADYPFLSVGTFGGTRFIQRGDALYLIVWTVAAVINISLFIRISGGLIEEVFPKFKYGSSVSAVIVLAAALCFTLTDTPVSLIYSTVCSGWAVILLAGLIPLAAYIAQRKGRSGS